GPHRARPRRVEEARPPADRRGPRGDHAHSRRAEPPRGHVRAYPTDGLRHPLVDGAPGHERALPDVLGGRVTLRHAVPGSPDRISLRADTAVSSPSRAPLAAGLAPLADYARYVMKRALVLALLLTGCGSSNNHAGFASDDASAGPDGTLADGGSGDDGAP